MKSCYTCESYITKKPHTCDICKSLDNDEDYTMWKEDKADYKKICLEVIGMLNTVSEDEKIEQDWEESYEHFDLKRTGYRYAVEDIVSYMIHLIYLLNLEKTEE